MTKPSTDHRHNADERARSKPGHPGLCAVQCAMTPTSTPKPTDGSPSRARRLVPVRRYGPAMEITQLGPADWESFRAVRLASLSESPAAFGSRYADWVSAPVERWQSRLTQVPLPLLAHEATEVIGVASGQPVGEDWVELISMWVAPAARATGVARQLIDAVTRWADERDRRTYLMVRSDNLLGDPASRDDIVGTVKAVLASLGVERARLRFEGSEEWISL